MARLLRVAVVLASIGFLASPDGALAYSNLVVFGDSLVDAGNTQALALGFGLSDPTPAASGYYDGRFTNGPNPADVLNAAIAGVYSQESTSGGSNYAYGGARARSNGDFLPDLVAQVGKYKNAVSSVGDPNALYLINVGGNDVFDILGGGSQSTITTAVVGAISNSVLTLENMGVSAQHILFVGIGDVGSPPSSNGQEALGRSVSIALNNAILGGLPAGVGFFDTIGLTDAVNANPALYGLPTGLLTEVSCLNSGAASPAGPPDCNAYAFFDDVHPTTQVLQVLGNALVTTVVPEPASAMLLSIGLAAIGMRRRARQRAVVA